MKGNSIEMHAIERDGRGSSWGFAILGRALGALALAAVFSAPGVVAQEIGSSLSLDEAISLARRHNPSFQTTANDEAAADWAVRASYGAFLPSLNTSFAGQYLAPGVPTFGIFSGDDIGFGTTDYYFSQYNINLSYSLSGSTLFQVASARADRRATEAGIRAAEYTLESAVTAQYLTALRARDGVEVARRQLERAEENYELAQGRVDVGAAIPTEGKQAEVEMGRAQVAVIEAESLERTEKLRLAEQLGVPMEGDFSLVSEFELFEPSWVRDDLVGRALDRHPQLRAYRAQESASNARVRESWSSYFPELFLRASWSGQTRQIGDSNYLIGQARGSVEDRRSNCEFMNQLSSGLSNPLEGYPTDCSIYQLTPADESAILAGNEVFPFDFRKEPWSLYLQVSLPVFQGFGRQRQLAESKAAAQDARFTRRAEELRVATAVTQAYDELETSAQVVRIEERNREVAGEQLDLARERYRLGAAPFLELLEAESSMATAERDYLDARYRFHGAIWALEAAVGERLRPEGGVAEGQQAVDPVRDR